MFQVYLKLNKTQGNKMFENYPMGKTSFRKIRKSIRSTRPKIGDSINEVLNLYKKYDSREYTKYEGDDFALYVKNINIVVLTLTQFDSLIEEVVSRIYLFENKRVPTNLAYLDTIQKMNFPSGFVDDIRQLRQMRNSFCHSYDFLDTVENMTTEHVNMFLAIKGKVKSVSKATLDRLREAAPCNDGEEMNKIYLSMLGEVTESNIEKTTKKLSQNRATKAKVTNDVIIKIENIDEQIESVINSKKSKNGKRARDIIRSIEEHLMYYNKDASRVNEDEVVAQIKDEVIKYESVPTKIKEIFIIMAKLSANKNPEVSYNTVVSNMATLYTIWKLQRSLPGDILCEEDQRRLEQFNEEFAINPHINKHPAIHNEKRYKTAVFNFLQGF